ncbi:MAG: class I SAM-dependent methyltransferase, partial [Candidatus Hodarchaeota archaeon]
MSDKRPSFSGEDFFKSTVPYYAKYRLPYPPELFDQLKSAFSLSKSHRILDLGCGTGRLSLPLSHSVKEVVAIDTSAEMIEEARKQADLTAIGNIVWHKMPAEAISPKLGTFHLATFGTSFHWM